MNVGSSQTSTLVIVSCRTFRTKESRRNSFFLLDLFLFNVHRLYLFVISLESSFVSDGSTFLTSTDCRRSTLVGVPDGGESLRVIKFPSVVGY